MRVHTKGGKTLQTVLVVLALFAGLAYFMAFNAGVTQAPASEIPYTEHWSTNLYRGTMELCGAINSFNQSSDREYFAAEREAVNKKPFSKENAIRKLKAWEGPSRYGPEGEKILCLLISQNTVAEHNQDKVHAQYKTWGKRCDRFVAFTNTSKVRGVPAANIVEVHPLFGDGDNNVWQKLRLMMQTVRAWKDFSTFDFVYIGGDDTFFIPENLRKLVNEPHYYYLHRMGVPFLLGHRMVSSHDGAAFVSGAGFVLNNISAKMLSHLVDGSRCKPDVVGGAEDLLIANCLQEYGVQPMNAADEFDEDRMHAFGPGSMDHVVKTRAMGSWWYPAYRKRPIPAGLGILSTYTISLHYIEPHDALAIAEHLYEKKKVA